MSPFISAEPIFAAFVLAYQFRQTVEGWSRAFDYSYSKRAFVHEYLVNDMDEADMSESREAIAAFEKDFVAADEFEQYYFAG